jgi:hypothetical protein
MFPRCGTMVQRSALILSPPAISLTLSAHRNRQAAATKPAPQWNLFQSYFDYYILVNCFIIHMELLDLINPCWNSCRLKPSSLDSKLHGPSQYHGARPVLGAEDCGSSDGFFSTTMNPRFSP